MKPECPECGSLDLDGEADEYQPDPWEIRVTATCTDCGKVVSFIYESPRLAAAIDEMEMNGGYYGVY